MARLRQPEDPAQSASGQRLTRRTALRLAAACLWTLGLSACGLPPDLPPSVVSPPAPTADEVTFFVTADTHFGAEGLVERNRRQIVAMNDLPGRAMPPALGGIVEQPLAVLVAGDLTDFGWQTEWQQFLAHYGPGGLLRYRIYETTGNHDRYAPLGYAVLDGVRARHGALLYGVALGPVRVICLDRYPDAEAQQWLARQLALLGKTVPVMLFFHYPLMGTFADWWSERDKEGLARVIQDYSVEAIFHGHSHDSRPYEWRGVTVYNVGSPKHAWNSFAVVRVEGRTLSVAAWDWDDNLWVWFHRKKMRAPAAALPRRTTDPAAAAETEHPDASDELAWLLGCWRNIADDTENVERWRAGPAGALDGDSRTTQRGRVVHRETMSIARGPQGLTYTATPSGQTRTTFRAVEVNEERVIFENLDHDYPQRIIYERTTPGRLKARIEGDVGGETKSSEWHWTRVDC
ncbi:MAG: metallophosphoesterase [Deltaproteobacteria bacterium]|nr:metallophosphoesterase [Deltaproteobacteria bacterium]